MQIFFKDFFAIIIQTRFWVSAGQCNTRSSCLSNQCCHRVRLRPCFSVKTGRTGRKSPHYWDNHTPKVYAWKYPSLQKCGRTCWPMTTTSAPTSPKVDNPERTCFRFRRLFQWKFDSPISTAIPLIGRTLPPCLRCWNWTNPQAKHRPACQVRKGKLRNSLHPLRSMGRQRRWGNSTGATPNGNANCQRK